MAKAQAAAYCGLTPSGFSAWVKAGIVPGPIPGTQRYDRKAIDAALDRHSGIVAPAEPTSYDPLEEWLKERGHPAHSGAGRPLRR
ncbi:hypothetical protein GBB76_17325 [Ancylobacter sp. TS-1]|nr:hypothetical protein GBB76_17325 [Ancylobacter sp. TS-1]